MKSKIEKSASDARKTVAGVLALTLTAGAVALPLGENGDFLNNVGISAKADGDELTTADGKFDVKLIGNNAMIVWFNEEYAENIVIPEYVDIDLGTGSLQKRKVIKLDHRVFRTADSVNYCKSIQIPKSVELIEYNTFERDAVGDKILYKVIPGSKAYDYIKEKGWKYNFYGKTPMNDKDISVVGIGSEYTYTGRPITQEITVNCGSYTLALNSDYTVSYVNNVNEGTATVKITGKGVFAGTIVRTFKINRLSLNSDVDFSGIDNYYYYTGSSIKPRITLTAGSVKLQEGRDYTVSYSNNVKEGTGVVTVTGKGLYKGTKKFTFRIVKQSVSNAGISNVKSSYGVTKAPNVKPRPKVYVGGKLLTYGRDYTLSYKNTNKLGVASVTINGKGKYKGTKTVKATPHNHRLPPLPHICLQIFRHIAQKLLEIRQYSCVVSVQSDEKSDFASARQWLCGVAIIIIHIKIPPFYFP